MNIQDVSGQERGSTDQTDGKTRKTAGAPSLDEDIVVIGNEELHEGGDLAYFREGGDGSVARP